MELNEKIIERLITPEDINSINEMHPFDLVTLYKSLDEEDQVYMLSLLSEEAHAELLSYLDPEDAAEFLEEMELDKQQALISLIDPDDAADIIAELPKDVSEELVSSLGEESKVVELLKYEEDQAGSVMNNLFVAVKLEDDIKNATRTVIKMAGEVDSIQTIFVTDEEGKYLGQFPLKTLLKSKPPLTVKDILTHQTVFVDTEPLEVVVHFMRDFSEHDLAIVNSAGVLVGVVTASDIIEEFHAEAMGDIAKLSALPEVDFSANLFKNAFKRLPWLLGLLALSIVIALVTAQFEAVIQTTIALVFFPTTDFRNWW